MYNPHTGKHLFPVYAVAQGGARLFIGWSDKPHKPLRTPNDLKNFYRTHNYGKSSIEGGPVYVNP